jgi:hypothetical protein
MLKAQVSAPCFCSRIEVTYCVVNTAQTIDAVYRGEQGTCPDYGEDLRKKSATSFCSASGSSAPTATVAHM